MNDMEQGGKGRQLKTLETAFKLLDLLGVKDGYDLSVVAEELGLAKSTVHGYLTTLENHGYVYKKGSEYYLGAELLTLGGQIRHRHPSYQIIIEKIEAVSNHTSERAQFIIEEGGRGIHIHVAKGSKGVEVNSRIGKRSYLHASAAGKTILAWSPEWKVDAIIDQWGLPELTQHTITDRKTLDSELSAIQQRGFAHNKEESIEGLHAVGVPIKDEDEVIGAISVSGPSHRVAGSEFEEEVPNFLLGVSNELELRISYKEGY